MGSAAPYLAPSPVADLVGFSPRFSWLPDSRRVVSALPSPRPGVHLWLMDTERAAPQLLTTTGGLENDPTVSPDGKRLALTLQQADYDLYQLSIDHPSPSAVLATSRNEMDPAWSEPGAAMAFTTDRAGRDEIWLRSQKGDWERPLVTPSDFGASQTYLLSAPAFSPDGQRIAYNRTGPEGARVWITPVAGGPPIQLAPGEFFHQDWPSWSPDGAWVAYVQSLRGDWSLMKMRVGARTPAEVVTTDILPESPRAVGARRGLDCVQRSRRAVACVHGRQVDARSSRADVDGVHLVGRQPACLRHPGERRFHAPDVHVRRHPLGRGTRARSRFHAVAGVRAARQGIHARVADDVSRVDRAGPLGCLAARRISAVADALGSPGLDRDPSEAH